jgi:hypothetical protein
MTINAINIHISPYRRIKAAGFDIAIKKHASAHRIQLINGAEVIAFADCPRTSNLPSEAMMAKARLGTWGPKSTVYKALVAFALFAETNAAANAAAKGA